MMAISGVERKRSSAELKSVKNIERKKVKRMAYVKAQNIEKVCIECNKP